MPFSKLTPILGAFGFLFAATVQADAHAHLVSASPADKSTVASPNMVKVAFNENLEAKFSSFEVTDAAGKKVEMAPVTLDPKGHKELSAAPKNPLPPGAYTVAWHVVGTDGHKVEGTYGFSVK